MKKVISIFLAAMLLISMTGCGKDTPQQSETPAEIEFPTDKITYYATGGSTSSASYIMLSSLGKAMEEIYGCTVVDFCQPWADCLSDTADAQPDGYTICGVPELNSCRSLIDPNDTADLNYQDMDVLCGVSYGDTVMGVRSDDERFSDVNDIQDMIDWLKANPDEELVLGCKTVSSPSMVAAVLLCQEAGCEDRCSILNSSSDSELNASILGKNVDFFITNAEAATTMYADGSAKMLGVFSEERSEYMPEVPTAKEVGFDLVLVNRFVMCTTKGTPQEIQDILIEMIEASVESDTFVEQTNTLNMHRSFTDQKTCKQDFANMCDKLNGIKEALGWV